MKRPVNPFGITRAVDLTDAEVESLWVDSGGDSSRDALFQPNSPVPLFIRGGRGSGKTHLMRYFSYPLQELRHARDGIDALAGIVRDGYLGVYVMLGALNSQRFTARGQPEHAWDALFQYALELALVRELLDILVRIAETSPSLQAVEADVAREAGQLIDVPLERPFSNLRELRDWVSAQSRKLDLDVNNVVFEGRFSTRVLITRGRLMFGLPAAVARWCPELRQVRFSYQLDEFEMLAEWQQVVVQTLLRERSDPATFRIGARMYGVLTFRTLVDGEENRKGAEYDEIVVDQRIRESGDWPSFARRLVDRRLAFAGAGRPPGVGLETMFEVPDYSWRSEFLHRRLGAPEGTSGRHFARFRRRLEQGLAAEVAPGLRDARGIEAVVAGMVVEGRPLLEKLNMLLVYQQWFRRRDLRQAAAAVAADCAAFLADPSGAGEYRQALKHYSSDLLAQLFRDFRRPVPIYLGFDTMMEMAECLPRSLVMMLKDAFAWSLYDGRPTRPIHMSEADQVRGVLEASDWFMTELRKPGSEGPAIRTGVERIARLFEASRFADKPVEVSLSTFAVAEAALSPVTARRLEMAGQRSLLLRATKLQIERNSQERLAKFQLNGMLAPKWSLPIARRGVVTLAPAVVDMIFEPDREDEFTAFLADWRARMMAPFFGRNPRRAVAPAANPGLFDPA